MNIQLQRADTKRCLFCGEPIIFGDFCSKEHEKEFMKIQLDPNHLKVVKEMLMQIQDSKIPKKYKKDKVELLNKIKVLLSKKKK